ncbi:helix-turn-helix transcriptional regulator [Escherichia coli]|nr:AlpA family phage regulatory protein [Escherichia coli]
MNITEKKILTKREVANLLRLSTTSIDTMIKAGEFIPGFKRGLRRVGWFEDEVKSWLEKKVEERYQHE